jgi:hypothetical protein
MPSQNASTAMFATSSPIAPGPTKAQSSRTGPRAATIRFIGHRSWWHSVRGSLSAAASRSCRRSHIIRRLSRVAGGQAAATTGWSHRSSASTGLPVV